ncbi:MAG: hypothetical protein HeimC3_10440 [Candidatus Heimdallarchaeota archaeon LC_3]|nr:MAG: hypothetical protein HeimC3_10440 [Candidatus Heimdallarchaeota archaeon LC_3]
MSFKDKNSKYIFELLVRLITTNIQLLINQSKQFSSKELLDKNNDLMTVFRSWLRDIKTNEDLDSEIRNLVSLVDNLLIKNEEETSISENAIDGLNNINHSKYSATKEAQITDSDLPYSSTENRLNQEEAVTQHQDNEPSITRIDIPSKTSKTLELLDRITKIGKEKKDDKDITQLFQRMLTPNDQWSYLETTSNILRNYSQIMHLALPNYCFAILEDIHRFTSADFDILHTVITTPYYALLEIIQKFLREAPSATILRRFRSVRRMAQIDIEEDTTLDIDQRNQVKLIVDNYFATLRHYLDSDNPPSIESFQSKIKEQFKTFSLGPSQVESRIIIVVKNLVADLIKKVENSSDINTSQEKVSLLATIDIFLNMTDIWLSEGRIRSLLEKIKD